MSRRRVYTEETLQIIQRFFEMFQFFLERGDIPNIVQFCQVIKSDRADFYKQKDDYTRGYFQTSWLIPLIELGVSPMWLLTGKGNKFIL